MFERTQVVVNAGADLRPTAAPISHGRRIATLRGTGDEVKLALGVSSYGLMASSPPAAYRVHRFGAGAMIAQMLGQGKLLFDLLRTLLKRSPSLRTGRCVAELEEICPEDTYWWFVGRRRMLPSDRSRPPHHPRILDAGCGTGATCERSAPRRGVGLRPVGGCAGRRAASAQHLCCCDVTALQFADRNSTS